MADKKQVYIDVELHRKLARRAVDNGTSIQDEAERAIAAGLSAAKKTKGNGK